MKYQVGVLDKPNDDDPMYADKQQAFDAVMVLSDDRFEEVFAVWTDDDSAEVIALAHNGELFRRDFEDFEIEIALPEVDGES